MPSPNPKVSSAGASSGSPPSKRARKSSPGKKSAANSSERKSGKRGGKASSVMEYLQSHIPRSSLLGLYKDEDRGRFVCRAVLQQLPEPSQQVIVRLSCCGGSFPWNKVHIWTKKSSTLRAHRELEELYRWAIIQEPPPASGAADAGEITLTPEFAEGLRSSLESLEASPWTPLTKDQKQYLEQEATRVLEKKVRFPKMTPEDLERYTQQQWDAVLHYLVGTPNMHIQPNPAVTHFLLQTNLMQPDPDYKGSSDDAPLVITQKGYDFMLQDNSQQVWHFVMQYLLSMESHSKAKELQKEALLVLICLSFSRFGDCYSAAALSKDGRVIMKDLALFGLLYVKKVGKTSIFYPTQIAMTLVGNDGTSSSGGAMWTLSSKALETALAHPSPQSESSHLAIIAQTNFQLCAYTTSELHVSMLGLFCDVQTIRRLPNVVFMTISRDSVKAAFALGIQAQQILRFLEKHAHPKLRRGGASPVPPNIVDQIYLWDRERFRVQWKEVFMHQCMLPGEFNAVKSFALGLDAHVWSAESRNQLFLQYRFAERVQTFVRQWRAKTAAQGGD